jgi:gamma-glutamylcyclotransferase (GGCT)/AIG2-like uncharacterized protein YtfP
MENLFAYGTLKNLDVQKKIFGRVLEGGEDILSGYRLENIIIDKITYPIIVTGVGSVVPGIVFNLSKKEIDEVDVYEGDQYERVRVVLNSGIKSWVYVKPSLL